MLLWQKQTSISMTWQKLEECAAKLPRVAVMGCVVNGPGEAKGADVALCGANGAFMVFVKGQKVCTVPESEAVSKVMEYVAALR